MKLPLLKIVTWVFVIFLVIAHVPAFLFTPWFHLHPGDDHIEVFGDTYHSHTINQISHLSICEQYDNHGHAKVSKWLSSSPNAAAQWSRRLVRQWVESDVARYGPRDKYWWATARLAESALLMDAISPEELLALTESVANRELSDALNKFASKWKGE